MEQQKKKSLIDRLANPANVVKLVGGLAVGTALAGGIAGYVGEYDWELKKAYQPNYKMTGGMADKKYADEMAEIMGYYNLGPAPTQTEEELRKQNVDRAQGMAEIKLAESKKAATGKAKKFALTGGVLGTIAGAATSAYASSVRKYKATQADDRTNG